MDAVDAAADVVLAVEDVVAGMVLFEATGEVTLVVGDGPPPPWSGGRVLLELPGLEVEGPLPPPWS